MNRLSLATKLACLNIAVLAVCCLGLAMALNLAAFAMADAVEAAVITIPAQSIGPEELKDKLSGMEASGVIEQAYPTQQIDGTGSDDARTVYLMQSALVAALTVIMGAILTRVIVKRETKGILDLTRHLLTCPADGLSEPYRTQAPNRETADLVASFNELGARVCDAIDSQKQFALAAAHELKTPLAVMRTRLDVFAKRAHPTAEDTERLVHVLSSQTDRLAELVNQLLVLARSERIERTDRARPVEIAREVAAELEGIGDADILIECETADAEEPLDKALFASAIRNALQNAIEHGAPPVTVTCHAGRIIVSNAGKPIDPKEAERLFEPFVRASSPAAERHSAGYGLGLATTRAIMRAHGGEARFLPQDSGVTLELTWNFADSRTDA